MSVCILFCVNLCFQVTKILENTIIWNPSLSVEWLSPVFLLSDIDLHFQGRSFFIWFLLQTSHKWWETALTLLLSSDRKAGICHRMAPQQMLYIMTLSNTFAVTNFEMWMSRKRWAIKKYSRKTFIGNFFPSNGIIMNVLLCELNLSFHRQIFQVTIRYLPSNGATANVVHHGLDLYFQGHKFLNVNRELAKIVSRSIFAIDWHHCDFFYFDVTLIFIVKVKHFLLMHLQ